MNSAIKCSSTRFANLLQINCHCTVSILFSLAVGKLFFDQNPMANFAQFNFILFHFNIERNCIHIGDNTTRAETF